VYQNPAQINQANIIHNNYTNQLHNLQYHQGQPIPVQGYTNNNVRPNSFDNVHTYQINQGNNPHYMHSSPPSNLNSRTVNYGNVYPIQSHPQQQHYPVSHVHPVTHHQDVRFNYAVNQQNYSITSQPLHNQGNVIPIQPQNVPVQINTQIPPSPQIQPTIQSGVQTSTVVTAVTTPPPIQTSNV
jgi:hypothetical protein